MRDWMRDDGVISLDDSIEMNEWNNESKEMWVEMRLPNEMGRLILEHIELQLNNNLNW